MKKQFLLGLMAMLLPLAALADSFVVKTTTFNYQGRDISFPSVYTSDGATQLTSNDYDVEVTYFSDESDEEGTVVNVLRNAGKYSMVITAKSEGSYSDYAETPVTLEVEKVELLVQPSEMHKTYGTPDSEVEISYYGSGYVGEDSKRTVDIEGLTIVRKEQGDEVGEYTVALGVTGAKTQNYVIRTNTTAQLIIDPAVLKVTFDALVWTYGETEDKLGEVTITGDGYVAKDETSEKDNDNTVALTWDFAPNANVTKETIRNAGTYPIIASINSKNYTLDPDTKTSNITINKKELTVSFEEAEALSKTYGQEDPDFIELAEVDGLVTEYGDTKESIGLTLTRSNDGENAGSDYTVDTANNDDLNNYTVKEFSEEFTINKKSLADADITITVAENNKVYQGQAADFTLSSITVDYDGKKVDLGADGSTELTDQTDYTFTITEGLKNAGSTVTVTVKAAENGNYTSENATCTFEIEKAPLELTATAQTIDFSTSASSILDQINKTSEYITVTSGELKNGDTLDDLEIEFSLNPDVTVTIGENANCIKIEAKGDVAANYDITYGDNATLTVGTGAEKNNSITIGRGIENTKQILEAYNGYKTFDDAGNFISGGFTVTVKGSNNVKANQWYSMVLPFDVKVRDFSKAIGYAVVDIPNESASTGDISFILYTGTIKANTLFIFKTDEQCDLEKNPLVFKLQGTKDVISDGKVVINYDPNYAVQDGAGNIYQGVYETTNISDYGYWYLSGGAFSDAGVYYEKYGKSVPVPVLTGYVKAASNKARILIEEPDGSTTVINSIDADETIDAEGWYTIGGVKLDGKPAQKGVYIYNGKKIVVK